MKKGVIISGISCLILLGTVGAITAGKIYIDNKQDTVTETSTYQSKEINHALATGDEVVGSWDVSENGDESVTATLYGDGKMVISGTGNMKNYTSSSDIPYYSNIADIQTVEIQNGVTRICDYKTLNVKPEDLHWFSLNNGKNYFECISGETDISDNVTFDYVVPQKRAIRW